MEKETSKAEKIAEGKQEYLYLQNGNQDEK